MKEKEVAYSAQRRNAKCRGIKWKINFQEWCDVWKDKWDQRGCRSGQYVMSRIGDKGPYSVANVRIITANENTLEQLAIRSKRMRIKLSKKIRPEFRKLIKAFRNYDDLAEYLGTSANNMAVMKRRGYLSVKLAELAEELSEGKYTARLLAKRGEIA